MHKERLDALDQFKPQRDLYRLNGKLQRFALKTFIGLMIGFWISDEVAPGLIPEEFTLFKIELLVYSMVVVGLLGTIPWLKDPTGTWKRAISEPGDLQGICNRCAAFMPLVGLGVLLMAVLVWLAMMYGG